MKKIIIAAALAIAYVGAYAQPTGNAIMANIKRGDSTADLVNGSYTMGIVDGIMASEQMESNRCIPAGVVNKQIADLIIDTIARRPNIRHLSVPVIAMAVMNQHYGCNFGITE